MPAPSDKVDREAVRTLAVAIGVREAARKLGLDENRVLQWSHRGKWFAQLEPTPQPPTVTKNDVITVIKPADALAETLLDASKQSKLSLSKAVRAAATHLSTLPGAQVLKSAKAMKEVASTGSTIFGWQEKGDAGVKVNIAVLVNGAE